MSPYQDPVAILRVQVLSCHNLPVGDFNGYSDPFVNVSALGNQFQTPVRKNTLNPSYNPEGATFDIPIYMPLVLMPYTLHFTVWDKDTFTYNDYLGEGVSQVLDWFTGSAFAFDDPNNKPFYVSLFSSRGTPTVAGCGTIRIKVGFVYPPNSTSWIDFNRIYTALCDHASKELQTHGQRPAGNMSRSATRTYRY